MAVSNLFRVRGPCEPVCKPSQEPPERLTHLYPEFSAHLMRVTETADWLEWRDWGNPVLAEPFEIRGGAIPIPDRPGAGIAWDEAAVKRFAI